MSNKKAINLNEVIDAAGKIRNYANEVNSTMADLTSVINVEALESNAPYLEELALLHKSLGRDAEALMTNINQVMKTIQADAEQTVANAGSLKTR